MIAQIVAAINPKPGQFLVEIGPGLGALTTYLLPLVSQLDVVELDRDIITPLRQACQGLGNLVVHQEDALRFDFTQLANEYSRPSMDAGNPGSREVNVIRGCFAHCR